MKSYLIGEKYLYQRKNFIKIDGENLIKFEKKKIFQINKLTKNYIIKFYTLANKT